MKLYIRNIALFCLSTISSIAFGAECRVNGTVVEVAPYTYDVRTTIRSSPDKTKILLDGYSLQCRWFGSGSPSMVDYWDTTSSSLILGAGLAGEQGGLNINGVDYNMPIPAGIRIATIPFSGTPWVNINAFPYVLLRRAPVNPIYIYAGDRVAELRIEQSNNYAGDRNVFYYRLIAQNNFSVQPSACSINDDQPLDVDFGTINASDIGESVTTTAQKVIKTITYRCPDPGISVPITVTFSGTGSSFNPRLIRMSNSNLAVGLLKDGKVVNANSAYSSNIINSSGRDDVTFALVKATGSNPVAGNSSGSAVLILGVP